MEMKMFHRLHISLVALVLAGYFLGHFTYQGIKIVIQSVSREKFHFDYVTNAYTSTMASTSAQGDPYNISVIKMDLQTRKKSSSLNRQFDGSDALPNKTNKVWVVTPTYRRGGQIALLSRLAQALYPVRHFVIWLVIDQYELGSELNIKHIDKHLKTFSIPYHLMRSTPRTGNEEKPFGMPKGVDARNDALKIFRGDPSIPDDDVAYFADDDNGYDSDIFNQMRHTKEISMWPTGILTRKTGISSPIVRDGKVVGFFDGWVANRKIPVDFAMFAISIAVIRQNPDVNFRYIAGYIETTFLQKLKFLNGESFYDLHDYDTIVQPMANNCTETLTWHSNTHIAQKKFKPTSAFEIVLRRFKDLKNLDVLYKTYYLPLQGK